MNHEFCSIAGSVTNLTCNDSPGGDRQSDRVKTSQCPLLPIDIEIESESELLNSLGYKQTSRLAA
jgi:hypothetical protein